MATALKPIGHDDRLSLVEHLDELRTRLIICVLAFSVAFGLCLWQNDRILHVMNRSLEHATQFKKNSKDPFEQSAKYDATLKAMSQRAKDFADAAARDEGLSPATQAAAQNLARAADTAVRAAPAV
jgi:sec-independent protein translocase protein TatC